MKTITEKKIQLNLSGNNNWMKFLCGCFPPSTRKLTTIQTSERQTGCVKNGDEPCLREYKLYIYKQKLYMCVCIYIYIYVYIHI